MSNLSIRIDEKDKLAAEKIFEQLGLTTSTAVKLFLNAVIREKGIPFNVTLSANPQGKITYCSIGEHANYKSVDTEILSKSILAHLLRCEYGAEVEVVNNPVIDMIFRIDNKKYALIIEGRQFSSNESYQDKLTRDDLDELYYYSEQNNCIPAISFVMIEPDGSSADIYLLDPKDLDSLLFEKTKGITGSMDEEGEVRISNAPRNRKILQHHNLIYSFHVDFKNLNPSLDFFM